MPNGHNEDVEKVQATKAGLKELYMKENSLLEQLDKSPDPQNSAIKNELKEVHLQQALIFFYLYKEAPFTYGTPLESDSLSDALSACEKALLIDPNYTAAKKLRDKIVSVSK